MKKLQTLIAESINNKNLLEPATSTDDEEALFAPFVPGLFYLHCEESSNIYIGRVGGDTYTPTHAITSTKPLLFT